MSPTLMKIYAASLALTVVFFGLSGVFARQLENHDLEDVARVVASKVGDPVELREVNDSFEVSEAIRKIEVEGESGRISVRPSLDQKVRVTFNGRVVQDPAQDEHGFRIRDSVLEVKAKLSRSAGSSVIGWMITNRQINASNPRLDVEIQVPVDWNGELAIKSINGDVVVSGIPLKHLQLKLVSGATEISSPQIQTLEAATVSGDIALKIAAVGAAAVKSVSGDIDFEGKIDRDLEAQTVSGELELSLDQVGLYRFQIETISGSITNELSAKDTPSGLPVRLKTTSGDIAIKAR